MIEKVECVMLECDNCKEPFESFSGYAIFPDESTIKEEADEINKLHDFLIKQELVEISFSCY